jgi:cardiolipin synthase
LNCTSGNDSFRESTLIYPANRANILLLSQIPNLLTLIRIAVCPVLVLLLHDRNYELALILFICAGITDGLDGFIAKKFDCVSNFGALLDPIADKLLIGSAYIMLAILGDIPFWLLIVVMFRDLVIVAGYLILVTMGHDVLMQPSYASKVNTFIQISLMVSVLLEKSGLDMISPVSTILVYGVLVTTIVSGIQYVWLWGIRQEFNNTPKT